MKNWRLKSKLKKSPSWPFTQFRGGGFPLLNRLLLFPRGKYTLCSFCCFFCVIISVFFWVFLEAFAVLLLENNCSENSVHVYFPACFCWARQHYSGDAHSIKEISHHFCTKTAELTEGAACQLCKKPWRLCATPVVIFWLLTRVANWQMG